MVETKLITYKKPVYMFKLVKIANPDAPRVKIKSSHSVADYMREYFYKETISVQEYFYVIFLNNSNNTVGVQLISMGGITGTLVDIRLIAKYALDSLAVSTVLVHNHPSGTLMPSEADKRITRKIKTSLETLDIKVLDHVIVTEESYWSFADEGMI